MNGPSNAVFPYIHITRTRKAVNFLWVANFLQILYHYYLQKLKYNLCFLAKLQNQITTILIPSTLEGVSGGGGGGRIFRFGGS